MAAFVNMNGKILPGDGAVIPLDNRAFHYGDGVFETMRVVRGRACFLEAHWERMAKGLQLLQIEMPEGLDQEQLARMIGELSAQNGLPHARGRLTVFRDSQN